MVVYKPSATTTEEPKDDPFPAPRPMYQQRVPMLWSKDQGTWAIQTACSDSVREAVVDSEAWVDEESCMEIKWETRRST